MRALPLLAAAVLTIAWPARAQSPIATAGGSGSGPTVTATEAAPPAPLPSGGPAWTPEEQPVAMGPCGPEKVKPNGQLDTAPHGEIEVGIGTGGYRHVAGAVCQPIGQNGAVEVGASYSEASPVRRRR